MKITPLFFIIFSLSTLTACRSAPPDKVEQINHMQVPLILPGEKSPAVQTSHIASLYQENKQQINTLINGLKSQYLQDVSAKDIFKEDSPVQPVYACLTRLEQLDMVNQQYLKDKNEAGLRNINLVLKPLITG